MTKPNKIDLINELLAGCHWHREHLEARWHELCKLHSCASDDEDGWDLYQVCYQGQPYPEMLKRIMHRRMKRYQSDAE